MKTIYTFLALFLLVGLNAQDRYLTRSGDIKFFSNAPLEDIEANTNKALSIVDLSKGQIAVDILVKSFEFEKQLMQEHFNENYMESDKYPKAQFSGTFEAAESLKQMREGVYEVEVSGDLTIHGVSKPIKTMATLKVNMGKLSGEVVFKANVKEFDIKIPKVVVKNIAEEVEITGAFNYEPYK